MPTENDHEFKTSAFCNACGLLKADHGDAVTTLDEDVKILLHRVEMYADEACGIEDVEMHLRDKLLAAEQRGRDAGWFSAGTTFDYRIFPRNLVVALFWKDPELQDAYLSASPTLDLLKQTIAEGYRWIRSEDDSAVFEKEVPK